ncbi:MAG: hypothetical protein ACRD43_06910 [Pyrinomonadaceae bacterium]
MPFARGVATRQATYEFLLYNDLVDLFLREMWTIEKAAEGRLVQWLESPNELGASPDEIEPVKPVPIDFDGKKAFYHVFKFRINEPHWAAGNGWMSGVVGPYVDDGEPYDCPDAVFSRLNSSSDDPEDEVRWVVFAGIGWMIRVCRGNNGRIYDLPKSRTCLR